jgi:predicted O-methyltransferase YrrM
MDRVAEAKSRAARAGFAWSCDDAAGTTLSVLAAAVPPGGRILEIGTGAGVGLAWLVCGLGTRDDAEIVTVEHDPDTSALAAAAGWPPWVRLVTGDVLELLDGLGRFSLVFADAPAGKWTGLDRTIAAVAPGGVLVVDDMRPAGWGSAEHAAHTARVRATLVSHPDLTATELPVGSGLIVCLRRP